MKKFKISLTISALLLCFSCSNSNAVQELNAHIQKVEREYCNYSSTDWEQANLEFEKIIADIEANYDKMSPAERDAAMKAIGRYYGFVAKQGIQNAAQETQKVLEALPSLIEGFTDAFK